MHAVRLAFFVFLAATAGCHSAPPPVTPTYTLRKVSLPDLSQGAPAVQQQLRDGFTVLTAHIAAADTSPDTLGDAYGQFGMLLLAASFRDEAERAFLNAQTFNPKDARWPHYLALVHAPGGPNKGQ